MHISAGLTTVPNTFPLIFTLILLSHKQESHKIENDNCVFKKTMVQIVYLG